LRKSPLLVATWDILPYVGEVPTHSRLLDPVRGLAPDERWQNALKVAAATKGKVADQSA
jgi:hypothetical protein